MTNLNNIFELYFDQLLTDMLDQTLLNTVMQQSMEEDELKRNDKVNIILEKVKYKEDEPKECEICLEQIKKDDYICNLDCFHSFHFDCIYEWMHYKKNCPVCRNKI